VKILAFVSREGFKDSVERSVPIPFEKCLLSGRFRCVLNEHRNEIVFESNCMLTVAAAAAAAAAPQPLSTG
jgi:hypothetical protein